MPTLTTSGRRLVGCLVLSATSILLGTWAPASAQTTGTTVLRSGLHSYYEGRVARVTVTEVGAREASPRVRIDLRDEAGRVVARTARVLTRTEPVRLDFAVTSEVQLRATVTIIAEGGEATTPVTVMEDLDPNSFAVEQRGVCAAGPPSGREGPQTVANCGCPGWVVSSFTTIP